MDPLSLLRDFTIRKQPVTENDGRLVFGEFDCGKSVETNFRSYSKKLYTIEAIWFLLQKSQLDHGKYIIEAKKAKVPTVHRVDRKDLLDYVSGKTDTCTKIDKSVLVSGVETVTEKTNKRPVDAAPSDGNFKRTKLTGEGAEVLAGEAAGNLKDLQKSASAASEAAGVEANVFDAAPSTSKSNLQTTKSIISRERVYGTRSSILRHKTSKPFQNTLSLLSASKRGAKAKSSQPSSRSAAKQPTKNYDRYNQPAQKLDSAKDFGINEYGSFMPSTVTEPVKPSQEVKRPTPKKRTSKTPIILVPGGVKSMITLYNVQQFLENGKYESNKSIMDKGQSKPHNVVVRRQKGGQSILYKVVENLSTLSKDSWTRVVAVFVDGAAWQFKQFPMVKNGGKPVDVFAKIKGFHVTYEGAPIPHNITQWDVTVLQLSRSKRHLDIPNCNKFWEVLDAFTSLHFPSLKT